MDPKFSSDMMLLEDSDDAGWEKSVISIEFGSLRHKLLIYIYIYVDVYVYIYIHMSHTFHSFLCFCMAVFILTLLSS